MPGNQTGTDMRQDQGAYEKSDVVDKVAQTLAKFGEVEDSTPEPESEPAKPAVSTPEPKPAEKTDVTPEPGPVEPAEPAEPTEPEEPEKPAIPDNYYRAAIHQGWKPEELSAMYELNPEGTLRFLEKTYNDVNNLSQQFAQLGRKAREVETARVQPQPQPQPQPQGFDVEKFKKAYEDDPASALATALQQLQTARVEPQPQPQPVQQPNKKDEWNDHLAAVEQLNTFFGAEDLKPFAEYYGEAKSLNWSDLTPGQYANRQAVINRADEILAGAELLQKEMSVREAVELAHMELSAPILQQVVREDILKAVKKKASGITMRPSKSKTNVPVKTGGKLSDAQILANAEARLADLRGRGT